MNQFITFRRSYLTGRVYASVNVSLIAICALVSLSVWLYYRFADWFAKDAAWFQDAMIAGRLIIRSGKIRHPYCIVWGGMFIKTNPRLLQ